MRNPIKTSVPQNNTLSVVFERFNDGFRAIISDEDGKSTFAYGITEQIAESNAVHNFQRKYYPNFHVL